MSDNLVQDVMKTIPPDVTVGIVIPLYGYWEDSENQQLNNETLAYCLKNVKSHYIKAYFAFVGERTRLSKSVKNVIISKSMGGGVSALDVEQHSTYAEYVKEGISYFLEETDASFVIVVNPWIMLKEYTIDQMIERLNKMD